MRRSKESTRSINFTQRNSLCFDNAMEYVRNLCDKVYCIEDYEFKKFKDDEIGLFVSYNNCKYIIYFDRNFIELKVITTSGELLRIFTLANCWHEAIKYITMEAN